MHYIYILKGAKCRKLDPFVKSLIEGTPPPSSVIVADTLSDIDGYKQENEKECYEFRDKRQPIKLTKGFFRIAYRTPSGILRFRQEISASSLGRKDHEIVHSHIPLWLLRLELVIY